MKKLRSFAEYLGEQKVPLYAANASFFLILSVFPVLVLLLALIRYTGLQVETLTDLISVVVPAALMPMVNRLVLSAYELHRYIAVDLRCGGIVVRQPGYV